MISNSTAAEGGMSMGVYIKGMKMPTRCGECPLSLYSHSPCWKNGGALDWEHRPNWCPLVPVPPHGRLIDADALIKDGWTLNKEVIRMGGYVTHELPLNNPSIPTIIEAEGER